MAKQVGMFKFLGKLGDWYGYLVDGEYYVRRIGKVDKKVRQQSPQFEETRKNEAEFGIATRCGGLFRQTMMHITQRWTTKHYPPKVIQLMMETLKSDTVHAKGQRSVNFGLKNAESQMGFRRLDIYTKKNYTHYRSCLMDETKETMVWKMNHQALWSRRDDGDTKSVKLGFLHVDFDRKIAKYEDALSITCKRNDQIQHSEVKIEPSGDIKLPWTFVIQQVWRDGDIHEPTGMLFMSVLQVIEGDVADEERWHGIEVADGYGLQSDGFQKSSVINENGVNWDVFLDGYLGDGFDEWVMGEEEKQGLDVAEDVEGDSEEELDMQVLLGLCGVEVADLYCPQELDEVEIVDGRSENEIHDSEDELSDQGLHHEEEIDKQVVLGLSGVEVVDLDSGQALDEVEIVDEHSEKELHSSYDLELQKDLEFFGVKVADGHCGDVFNLLNIDVKEKGGMERNAACKLDGANLYQPNRQKKKRFQRSSAKGQILQGLHGRRLVLQDD